MKGKNKAKMTLWLVVYLLLSYMISFFFVSEFVGVIGIPVSINKVVTLKTDQTFDHLFLVTDIKDQNGVLYTVNNSKQYNMEPDDTIPVDASSDFNGTIHVNKIVGDTVQLSFHLHRTITINIVIGIVSIFILIPFYYLYGRLFRRNRLI